MWSLCHIYIWWYERILSSLIFIWIWQPQICDGWDILLVSWWFYQWCSIHTMNCWRKCTFYMEPNIVGLQEMSCQCWMVMKLTKPAIVLADPWDGSPWLGQSASETVTQNSSSQRPFYRPAISPLWLVKPIFYVVSDLDRYQVKYTFRYKGILFCSVSLPPYREGTYSSRGYY